MISKIDSLRMMLRLSSSAATVMVLARELDLPPATASRAVSTLERLGWVERARSSDDRRFVQVCLSAAGSQKLKEVGINPESLKLLDGLLRALESSPAAPIPESLDPEITASHPVASPPQLRA